MSKTIFFSWQSDTPTSNGRNFLKDVFEKVCADITLDTTLEESLRDLAVDSDTQGVAGHPPIVDTIFKKIDAASVFISDITFTGSRIDKRPTPNPNVLIEYGWALKSMTHQRVICVMNTAYGEPTRENMPFNLAHLRWPIIYNLPENASPEEKATEKRRMTKAIKEAIYTSLGTIPISEEPSFPRASSQNGPSRFRKLGEAIGFEDGSFAENKKEVFLVDGPAMWLRLMPTIDVKKQWPAHKIKELMIKNSNAFPLISPSGGYSYVRADDGEGVFHVPSKQTAESISMEVGGISFIFETGEIWSIDTFLPSYRSENIFYGEIEEIFPRSLKRYGQFLHDLDIQPPYRWVVGMTGIKGRSLQYVAPPRRHWIHGPNKTCVTDTIEIEGEYDGEEDPKTVLSSFFDKVFEKCGLERPDYLK